METDAHSLSVEEKPHGFTLLLLDQSGIAEVDAEQL